MVRVTYSPTAVPPQAPETDVPTNVPTASNITSTPNIIPIPDPANTCNNLSPSTIVTLLVLVVLSLTL